MAEMPRKIYPKSGYEANKGTRTAGRRQLRALGAALTAWLLLLSCGAAPSGGRNGAASKAGSAPPQAAAVSASSTAAPSSGANGASSGANGPATAAPGTAGAASAVAGTAGAQAALQSLKAYAAFVSGNVTIAGGASKRELRVGDPVPPGARLTTARGSATELRIGTIADFGLGEEASLAVTSISARSGGGPVVDVSLTLDSGALLAKLGESIAGAAEGGAAPSSAPVGSSGSTAGPAVLLELSTPRMFVTSTGGSLLVRSDVGSLTCAVGLGQAWLVPSSLVYTDLVSKLNDPKVEALLDSILSRAVPIHAGEEISVPYERLRRVDEAGITIHRILQANIEQRSFPAAASARLAELVGEANGELAGAVGSPGPLDAALRTELLPGAVIGPKMMRTPAAAAPAVAAPAGSASGKNGAAPGTSPPAFSPAAPGAPPATAVASTSTAADSASGTPFAAAAGSSTESSQSSSGNSALAKELLKAVSRLFDSPATPQPGAGPSTQSGSPPQSSGAAGSSGGGPVAPTPPTPPTPPSVP